MRFIAAGAMDSGPVLAAAETQGGNLASLAGANPGTRTWWALDRRRGPQTRLFAFGRPCVAAAMIVPHPGGSGFLFHCPLDAPGVDAPALEDVVRQATAAALADGMHFVQVSMLSGGPAQRQAAADWGYVFVAELIYMALDLPGASAKTQACETQARGPAEGYRLRTYSQFTEAELGGLILATYEQSLDCPALLPLRTAEEIIASHKASGQFRPEGWWIADAGGEAAGPALRSPQGGAGPVLRSPEGGAGCILVNDRPLEEAAEVMYLGVRPEHRGKGLARSLLDLAAQEAGRRGLRRLLLAVDSRNVPALGLYERAGFRQRHRRWVFAAIRR